jgi:hypothetical protein
MFAWVSTANATPVYLTRTSLDGLNSLVVASGSSTVALDNTNLGSRTYRVASSWLNGYSDVVVMGPTGESGYQIGLAKIGLEGNTAPWDGASLVFKIDAPSGQMFNGGTIGFITRHMGSWNANNLTRWRAATFASEPSYAMNGSVRTFVDFGNALSSQFYTLTTGNAYETLTLNMPTGVSSFFAVLGMPQGSSGNSTVRLGGVRFDNVVIVPEPSVMTLLSLGGVALWFTRKRKR